MRVSRVRPVVACVAALAVVAPAHAASAVAAPAAPKIDLRHADRCDFLLGGSECLAPFPNDYFTKRDKRTDTGRRVAFARAAMPANTKGVRIDPQHWNHNDGFPPGSTMIVKVPGMETPAAYAKSRLHASDDIGASTRKDASAVVVDVATGKRQLIWTELDANADTDKARNLEIHPAKNLLEGHRYVVALRGLRTAAGKAVPVPKAFRIYRDRLVSKQKAVNKRRAHFESLFRALAKAGVARKDLWVAWDFTVSSERSISERALAIRDDAFRQLGDTNLADQKVAGKAPAFTVEKVTEFSRCTVPEGERCPEGTDRDLRRQVEGTFDVPCYLDNDGCEPGGAFRMGKDGLPEQRPGNVDKAPFVCNVPFAAQDGAGVHRLLPALYGHGLFGDVGETRRSRNVHQLGDENGVLVCGTDFQGMADEDVSQAVPILQDLSGFHRIADRLQQGFLNFLFLGRLLVTTDGFAAADAFKLDGQSVVDTSRVAYYGNSQGGIQGGPVTALSPDVTASVLYVPGITYSVLLPRSVDFDDPSEMASFANVLYGRGPFGKLGGYADSAQHPLVLDLMQMLWDRGEPSGYAQHMTSDPLPNTPKHTVLIEMSIGDHQVANVQAEVEARTIGAALRKPAFDPGRSAAKDPAVGLGTLGSLPRKGSAIIPWDIGPLRQQDGKEMGTNVPPVGNTPNMSGQDPHDYVIEKSPLQRKQIAQYMRDGTIVEVCGGKPCRTPDWTG